MEVRNQAETLEKQLRRGAYRDSLVMMQTHILHMNMCTRGCVSIKYKVNFRAHHAAARPVRLLYSVMCLCLFLLGRHLWKHSLKLNQSLHLDYMI